MSSQLLIETTSRVAMVAIALGVVACAKALTSVLRTWIEQTSRTRRLVKALEDTRPNQRPEIILACSELEGGMGKRGQQTGVEILETRRRRAPTALALQGRHEEELHGG